MSEETTVVAARLTRLYKLMETRTALDAQHEADRQAVIPKKVRLALSVIDQDYDIVHGRVQREIDQLEQAIKTDVIALGETVRSTHLLAVYTPPKITWDTPWLEGYAAAHPEVLTAKKEGKATCGIRKA